MQLARHDRVLIAWDRADGPMFGTDKKPIYHHYRVLRDGREVATTYAEGYIDDDVSPSRAYRYQVKAYRDAGETEVVDAAFFSVSTTARPPADLVPPTAPSCLRGSLSGSDIVWRWNPSSKLQPDEMLAYLVENSTSGQPRAIVWEHEHPTLSWTEIGGAGEERCYRLRSIDRSLNISEPSEFSELRSGWTVYTFKASSSFELKEGWTIDADLLLVGGGGAGGGGLQGGGGGAGGFRDEHNVVIRAGENDGAVTVGAGGAAQTLNELAAAGHGNDGEASTFGDFTAYGGGCGSSEVNDYDPPLPTVPGGYLSTNGADGASGGGGSPWGVPSVFVTDHYEGPGGAAVHGDQGHAGGHGKGYQAWYQICTGGGGGAHEPYKRDAEGNLLEPLQPYFWADQFGSSQSMNPEHGGHGRPCDIRGWHLYEETAKALMFVDWYAGGGAGGERKVWWGYASGKPGYGGGGAVFDAGAANTGGGGGGAAQTNYTLTQAPPSAGGSGIVVVRIRTCDEDLVTWPLITGTDPDSEHNEFGLPVCLCDDPAVEIRRLPQYMTHDDESGDEQCPRTYEETH